MIAIKIQRFIGEEGIITNKEGQSAKTYGVFNAVYNYIIPLCCNTYLDVEPWPMSFWLQAQRLVPNRYIVKPHKAYRRDPEDTSGWFFVGEESSVQFITEDEAIQKAKMIYAWMEV